MPILPPRMGLKIMQGDNPTFYRDFAFNKTLNHGIGPNITFTRTGTATYFDATGTLTTATADVPRFDHDPSTLESKGLLIEEGRTNSIRNSQAGGAVNGSAGTSPTNWPVTSTANGITRTISTGSTNGFNYIDFTYSGTPTSSFGILMDPEQANQVVASQNQTWTSSVYIALISGSVPDCLIGVREALSDATLVAIGTTNFASSLTSALQRFSHTRTLAGTTTVRVGHRIQVTATNGVAINFTLRIAAPQLEQGAFATSYIPTTSAAVTRGNEITLVNPISSFFNPSQMSLFAEMQYDTALNNQPVEYWGNMIRFYPSSGTSPMIEYYTQIRGANATNLGQNIKIVNASNVNQAEVGFNTPVVAGSINKYACGIATNNVATFKNGSAGLTDNTVDLSDMSQLTRMSIGMANASTGVSNFLNGHIRKVAYWPKRLPNARLQAITA